MYLNNHWLVHSERSARLLESWVIQRGYDLKILPVYWETFSNLLSTMLSSRQHNFLTGMEIFMYSWEFQEFAWAQNFSSPASERMHLNPSELKGCQWGWVWYPMGDQRIKHLDWYCFEMSFLMMPCLTILRQFVNESAISFSTGEFSGGMRQ